MLWEYNSAQWILLLFAAFAVLFLPGYVMLRLFLWKNKDIGQTMAVSLGLSIASVSLTAQFLFILPWEPPSYSFLVTVIVLTILALGFALSNIFRRGSGWISWGLILGVVTSVAWRFFQVRQMVLPAWTESLDHVLITRKILEIGRIPENLEPYLSVSFNSYFSFDILCAAFAGLSGCTPANAVFLVGQILNGLMALSIYRLAMLLLEERRYAITAAALVLFLATMPAGYVRWGSFSLLTGMVLVPLALAEGQSWSRHRDHSSLGRLLLLTSGTLLADCLAAVILAMFLACWIVAEIWKDYRRHKCTYWEWGMITGCPVIGFLLSFPWLSRLWTYLGNWAEANASSRDVAIRRFFLPNLESVPAVFSEPWQTWLLAGTALLGLGLAWLNSKTRLFAAWSTLLLLAAIPLGCAPGPFRPEYFLLVIFIPVTILTAGLFSLIQTKWAAFQGEGPANWVTFGILSLVLLAGIGSTFTLRTPETTLAEREDLLALRWLGENTSRQARFLVNAVPAEWSTYRAADGGAWILPLTGRWGTIPPPLYAMGSKEFVSQATDLVRTTTELTGCDDRFRQLLHSQQITHVYLGVKPGRLTAEQLDRCPVLEEIYSRGPVRIFHVKM